MDEIPPWVRSGGLFIDPRMPGHLIAWLRRSDGGWVAVVELEVSSPNQRSRATAYVVGFPPARSAHAMSSSA